MMQQTAMKASEPQRLRALGRANEIRLARAGLKRRIALGEVSAAEVLLTCPEEAGSWPIGDLLISQRRWGTTRCRKFLSRNDLVETKPIGKLTERQRRILAASLQAPAARAVPVGPPMVPVRAAASPAAASARVEDRLSREMAVAVA